ncbi:uncharacterized protein C2845_PM17G14520 [Panicum miliaceum]|uniref:non-specific serine/threonine protein kinase n=1 Tax=Panicum miliaceum TaxID=4540 RepID=A0A3L6Q2E3_PANMI|nr:uncharacterized protein C2845_PM17G14520 [Panicum miliaceum]
MDDMSSRFCKEPPANIGVLRNGVAVAIKKGVHESIQRDFEFENELQIIPKFHHANVIKLLGCCIEGDQRILVYEYMPRSLDKIIQELKAGGFLAWPLRFRIIEGIAQGAVYLHQHSRPRLVHKDLKPANILLDCDMTPRITDFGIAEVLESDEDEKETYEIAGTLGYLDPESVRTSIISTKSDVYGFGVTSLQIMTAQDSVMEFEFDTMRRLLVEHGGRRGAGGARARCGVSREGGGGGGEIQGRGESRGWRSALLLHPAAVAMSGEL